jgi:lipopolysaccharide export LptBFGC system permease protein LptF
MVFVVAHFEGVKPMDLIAFIFLTIALVTALLFIGSLFGYAKGHKRATQEQENYAATERRRCDQREGDLLNENMMAAEGKKAALIEADNQKRHRDNMRAELLAALKEKNELTERVVHAEESVTAMVNDLAQTIKARDEAVAKNEELEKKLKESAALATSKKKKPWQ